MLKKAAALFVVCASLVTWIGCGTTSSRYLYAAIPASSQIVAYREDPNSGVLTALAGSPITAGAAVQSLALHPSKKFLYAANSGSGDVSLFTISSTGALTEVTPRANAGIAPSILTMDAAGGFLYVGNVGSADISVFSIDASKGTLTQVGTSFPIGTSPLNMLLSPSGNFLYVTSPGAPGFIQAVRCRSGISVSGPGITISYRKRSVSDWPSIPPDLICTRETHRIIPSRSSPSTRTDR